MEIRTQRHAIRQYPLVTIVTWLPFPHSQQSAATLKLPAAEKFSSSVVAELKRVREAKGFSQGLLAEATGLSRSAITMIENGQRNPTLIVCQAIALALGVNLSSVLRRVEKESISPKKP